MIERVRALCVVVGEGSLNRAAVRLHLSQSALSRKIQSLEDDIGGVLLEREPSGIKPTNLGHRLMKAMRPVIDAYDAALGEVRRQAAGEKTELRVGYLVTAAPSVLTPALIRWQEIHPDVTLILQDLSPREQLDGLRAGELDVALIGQEGAMAAREFYSHNLRSFGVVAAVSASDPLAARQSLTIGELKGSSFIGIDETEMPGRNRWMTSLCRTSGFKPRFVSIPDGITHVLSQVVSESAVTLLPSYFQTSPYPGVVFVPISDPGARWDLFLLWQRGQVPASTRALVTVLKEVSESLS